MQRLCIRVVRGHSETAKFQQKYQQVEEKDMSNIHTRVLTSLNVHEVFASFEGFEITDRKVFPVKGKTDCQKVCGCLFVDRTRSMYTELSMVSVKAFW